MIANIRAKETVPQKPCSEAISEELVSHVTRIIIHSLVPTREDHAQITTRHRSKKELSFIRQWPELV